MSKRRLFIPFLASGVAVFLALFILACGTGETIVSNIGPRWACPSPVPKPWGPEGPVKEVIPLPTNPPSSTQEYEEVYYQEWEQEYPTPGLQVYPSPTPYGIVGTNYTFGQRVSLGPVFITMNVRSGEAVEFAGQTNGTLQVHFIDIHWLNRTTVDLPFDYSSQVRLRAVLRPDGRIVTDSTWAMIASAERLSGHHPPEIIPPGESAVTVPVIAPLGTPKTAELVYLSDPSYVPSVEPTPTLGPETPTPTPPLVFTPTPNTDLRRAEPNEVVIQWTDAEVNVGPPCSDEGAVTEWENGYGIGWGQEVAVAGVAAPPGANRLVQLAMNQVGKPYVWGAKGPERFDCSGLTQWAYGQIGITIPSGTGRNTGGGQFHLMKPVTQAAVQPGDLIFFDLGGKGYVDHVGMLTGDVNGDGTWDMVHAASPKLGVRMDYNVFASSYYSPRIAGFRTAR